MKISFLIMKNALRHPLRTSLTVLGLALAVLAFMMIRTFVDAWFAGAEAASPNRLVTRHAVSLTFFLPIAYEDKIASVDGVNGVAAATWFGGVYKDPSNFFAQFAVEHESYFDLVPEYVVPPEQMEAFNKERNAAIVGRALADRFGWALGDNVTLSGTIFPGDWEFVIRGIYTAGKEGIDENTWFHRWDYVDETLRQITPRRAGWVGSFSVGIDDPSRAAEISSTIDRLFANSQAETKTETEEAFIMSFIQMSDALIKGLNVISGLVVGVILLVLGNTMAMTARERVSEYALMKSLGFRTFHLVGLVFGESVFIALLGGFVGLLITVPIAGLAAMAIADFFPAFKVTAVTQILAMTAALVVGLLAALFPTLKAVRTPIVDGLRIIE